MKSSSKIIFKIDPTFSKCSNCGQFYKLRHSHSRNLKEKLILQLTFLKLYRCKNCGWHGYKSTFILTKQSFGYFIFYIFIAILSGFVVFVVLKKVFY